jgi:hypothetical protein
MLLIKGLHGQLALSAVPNSTMSPQVFQEADTQETYYRKKPEGYSRKTGIGRK